MQIFVSVSFTCLQRRGVIYLNFSKTRSVYERKRDIKEKYINYNVKLFRYAVGKILCKIQLGSNVSIVLKLYCELRILTKKPKYYCK